jgi:hypothetical protein
MHGPSHVLRRFQFAFHESFVDYNLWRDIGEFASLPQFYLLLNRINSVPGHHVLNHLQVPNYAPWLQLAAAIRSQVAQFLTNIGNIPISLIEARL